MSSSERNCMAGSAPRTWNIQGKERQGHSAILETMLCVWGPTTIDPRKMMTWISGCCFMNSCAIRSTSALCLE